MKHQKIDRQQGNFTQMHNGVYDVSICKNNQAIKEAIDNLLSTDISEYDQKILQKQFLREDLDKSIHDQIVSSNGFLIMAIDFPCGEKDPLDITILQERNGQFLELLFYREYCDRLLAVLCEIDDLISNWEPDIVIIDSTNEMFESIKSHNFWQEKKILHYPIKANKQIQNAVLLTKAGIIGRSLLLSDNLRRNEAIVNDGGNYEMFIAHSYSLCLAWLIALAISGKA